MVCFDNVLRINPNDAESHYHRGMALSDMCRFSDAVTSYAEAIRLSPTYTKAYVGKCDALIAKGMMTKGKKGLPYFSEAKTCVDIALGQSNDSNERTQLEKKRQECDRLHAMLFTYHRPAPESCEERLHRDSLEQWLDDSNIDGAGVLLGKLRASRDGPRRKDGDVFHAELVKLFHTDPDHIFKVAAIELSVEGSNSLIDIKLDDDIYIESWYGKTPYAHSVDENLLGQTNGLEKLDWCIESKKIKDKMAQLPNEGAKCFLLEYNPGVALFVPYMYIRDALTTHKCYMVIYGDHINMYGNKNFEHKKEAHKIAKVLRLKPVPVWGNDSCGPNHMSSFTKQHYGYDPADSDAN